MKTSKVIITVFEDINFVKKIESEYTHNYISFGFCSWIGVRQEFLDIDFYYLKQYKVIK